MTFLEKHQSAISRLCKTYKVKDLCVFGSVITEKFNSESDVDLVVDFQQIDVLDYADNYFDLKIY